ncbi:MAG: energy-coupling factor ABC transporter ATP-binding protein [Candidatus Muiribacteriota bacterium]
MENTPVIEFDNVSYTYNRKTPFETRALQNISFQILKGEIVAVCGSTGSGKTTLIKMINRLLVNTSGTIKVSGQVFDSKLNIKELRKKVGMIFQYPDHQIFESSVKKELIYAGLKFGMHTKHALKKAKEACDNYGFDFNKYKNRNPFELSGGEKRKVAICSILAYEPEILIFDEPTAGLDNKGLIALKELILKLNGQGKTIILISHDADFIDEISHKIIVLKKAVTVYNGKTESFMKNYSKFEMEELGLEKPFRWIVEEKRKLQLSQRENL